MNAYKGRAVVITEGQTEAPLGAERPHLQEWRERGG
jgi:hypothetical protein